MQYPHVILIDKKDDLTFLAMAVKSTYGIKQSTAFEVSARALGFRSHNAIVNLISEKPVWITANAYLSSVSKRLQDTAALTLLKQQVESLEQELPLTSTVATQEAPGLDKTLVSEPIIRVSRSRGNNIPQPASGYDGVSFIHWDHRVLLHAAEQAINRYLTDSQLNHWRTTKTDRRLDVCCAKGTEQRLLTLSFDKLPHSELWLSHLCLSERISESIFANTWYAIHKRLVPFHGLLCTESPLYNNWPIRPVPVTRTDNGMYHYPSLPDFNEDTPNDVVTEWLVANKSKFTSVMMTDQVSDEQSEEWFDVGISDCSFWHPVSPDPTGVLACIVDTEDGPAALFLIPDPKLI